MSHLPASARWWLVAGGPLFCPAPAADAATRNYSTAMLQGFSHEALPEMMPLPKGFDRAVGG